MIINLLKDRDKSIDLIQSILKSKEVKNISKKSIEIVANFVIAFRNNQRKIKKANSNKEYYNCYKLGYFGHNYSFPDK